MLRLVLAIIFIAALMSFTTVREGMRGGRGARGGRGGRDGAGRGAGGGRGAGRSPGGGGGPGVDRRGRAIINELNKIEGPRGGRRGGRPRGGGPQWGVQNWRRRFRKWRPRRQRYSRGGWGPIFMPVDSWWPRFYAPCKEGCMLTGNGGYGCPYPGNGYNQCQFSRDCSGCQSWW